jgi:Zn-dependent protease
MPAGRAAGAIEIRACFLTAFFRIHYTLERHSLLESVVGAHSVNIGELAIQYVCLLFSLCVHEAAHALMANRCGDPSARLMGRATLNPLAHIDPIGTVVMPLLMMATGVPFLFGWAKPVPFNPRNLRNMRRDPALIGAAGPLANLLMAFAFAFVLRGVVIMSGIAPDSGVFEALFAIAFSMVLTNLALALFNLIPIPPLDGGHVLYPLLPREGQRLLEQIGPFGILIAIFLANRLLPGPLMFLRDLALYFAFWGHV